MIATLGPNPLACSSIVISFYNVMVVAFFAFFMTHTNTGTNSTGPTEFEHYLH